jgi:hypothetical protein
MSGRLEEPSWKVIEGVMDMKKTLVAAAGVGAVVATVWIGNPAKIAFAQEASGGGEQQPSDRYAELVKERGEFQETWVLPGIDATKYNKVFLWEGQFEYRDVGPARKTRSTMLSTHKREFGISEEDRRRFEEIVGEAFTNEIVKAKNFTIIDGIDEIDSGTLIMRGALLDIISRVPPETVGRSDVYLSSVGAATFVIELIDAQTGSVVALAAERRSIETINARGGFASVPANSASVMGDIKRWSSGLARRLRNALDKAVAG